MRRSEREKLLCQLMCGRLRAPKLRIGPYALCEVCHGRVWIIVGLAKRRTRKLKKEQEAQP